MKSYHILTTMIPLCGISKSTDEQVRPEKRPFSAFFGVKRFLGVPSYGGTSLETLFTLTNILPLHGNTNQCGECRISGILLRET